MLAVHTPQTKLSGFGGKFRATESLWCIGSKVCWANLLTNVALYRATNVGNDGSTPNFLVTGLKFDFEQFARLTGVTGETAKAGTGLRLISDDSPLLHDMAFRHLRYCPDCMKTGFHSVLFQFPLFSHCPEHNVPLIDNCPSCGGIMDHRWPTSRAKVFTCTHCDHRLWQPRQERYAVNKADACFGVMADWASGWMRRVIRFSGSNAPLKRWVTAGEDEKWTARGLPELAGIFTPRSLLNDAKKSYWGGRTIFSRDGPTMAFPMADIYSMQCRIVGNRVRLPPDALKGLSEASMLEGRATKKTSQLWAFIAWRAFWESASTVSGLLGSDAEKGAENAAALFRSYFNALIVPGGFSDYEQALLNSVAQREVLRASFAYSLTNASRKGATLSRVVKQLPETPLPVILARPVPSGVVVEWIHQRELAAAGRAFFD